jgi:hypothetical protein
MDHVILLVVSSLTSHGKGTRLDRRRRHRCRDRLLRFRGARPVSQHGVAQGSIISTGTVTKPFNIEGAVAVRYLDARLTFKTEIR